MTDPTLIEASRELDAILRDVGEFYALGVILISRLASRSDVLAKAERFDSLIVSARSELCLAGTLIEDLSTEESRSRRVAS